MLSEATNAPWKILSSCASNRHWLKRISEPPSLVCSFKSTLARVRCHWLTYFSRWSAKGVADACTRWAQALCGVRPKPTPSVNCIPFDKSISPIKAMLPSTASSNSQSILKLSIKSCQPSLNHPRHTTGPSCSCQCLSCVAQAERKDAVCRVASGPRFPAACASTKPTSAGPRRFL